MILPRTLSIMQSTAIMLVLIVFASAKINSEATVSADNPDYSTDHGYFKIISRKEPLEMKCSVRGEGFTIIWRKNGQEIKEGITKVANKDNNETSILKITKPETSDAGDYECLAKSNATGNATLEVTKAVKVAYIVYSLPTGSLDVDNIVVEGETLRLDCQPDGAPIPEVTWTFRDNITLNGSSDHVKLLPNKNNVSNAIVEIKDVKMTDHGEYKCVLSNSATRLRGEAVVYTTKVRVKDKLAALWPFLGICAEVIVLCAIIFIYEKKRNKAELDESDTDNSPEQKNTPDHGKDSVRQRK